MARLSLALAFFAWVADASVGSFTLPMLLEFKVSNFRSIREEQILSFIGTADSEELPGNFVQPRLPGMGDSKVLKAIALYGANASGKSNVIAALQFFADFAANSFTGRQPEAPTGTQPFGLEPEWAERPTTFEVSAIIEGVRTTYGLALTVERVIEEYLVVFPAGKPETRFEREWKAESGETEWIFPATDFQISDELKRAARKNCTLVSAGAQFNQPQLTAIHRWWVKGLRVLAVSRGDSLIDETARLWIEGPPEVKKAMLLFTQHADLGVTNVSIEKSPEPESTEGGTQTLLQRIAGKLRLARKYEILLSHRGRDGDVPLPFAAESTGTQRFFGLTGPVVQTFVSNSILCIDEIEASLHPLLVRGFLQVFGQTNESVQQPQLLVTTHNPLLLDRTLLRPDQIWFTEKDKTGATTLYPLTDYQERHDEPLVNGYLAGRYGGIPFIPGGLLPK